MNTSIHIIILLDHKHTKAIFCSEILLLEASEFIPYLCFLNLIQTGILKYILLKYTDTREKKQELQQHTNRSKNDCQCVISTLLAEENDIRTLLHIDFRFRHLFIACCSSIERACFFSCNVSYLL